MASVTFNPTSDHLFHDNRWWFSGEAAEVNSCQELESHQNFIGLCMVRKFNRESDPMALQTHEMYNWPFLLGES